MYSFRDRKTIFSSIVIISSLLIYLNISNLLNSDNNPNNSSINWGLVQANNSSIIDLNPVSADKLNGRSRPIILYLTDHFIAGFDHFIPTEKTKINCPYKCFYTADRSKYGHIADVRLFDQRYINEDDLPPDNPKAINVYHTFEPPYLTFSIYATLKIPDNYFNVTSSYRSAAELYYPYDYFMKRDGTETKFDVWTEKQIETAINKKRKTALIVMSNCGAESKRHDVVRELQKYINVTVIGSCMGNNKQCGRNASNRIHQYDTRCVKERLGEHFFYLAFENSVCPEYVTEKFWRLRQLIVPVVLSRAAMPSHIPNDTYIAASDFESLKALVDYLEHLMDHKEEYKKYFDWTKTYRKSRVKEEQVAYSCQICKLAYKQEVPQVQNFEIYSEGDECSYGYGHNLINNTNAIKEAEQKMREIMKNTERKRSIGLIL